MPEQLRARLATQVITERQFFPTRGLGHWLVLGCLFVSALGVRLIGIAETPLDVNPVKQYRSALTARALYYRMTDSVPAWKKEVAETNLRWLGALVPPITEGLAALVYRVAGREILWAPRLLSALSWLIGGVFLYLIARRIGTVDAAIVSTAFYLFLPASILTSQSFQPDPAMVMMMIISLYAVLRYDEAPSRGRLALAIAASALAILLKGVALFMIFGAYLALTVYRRGVLRGLLHPHTYAFLAFSLLPSALFYAYTIHQDILGEHATIGFLPHLLLEFSFWQFWLKHIYAFIGFAALVGALLGLLVVPNDWRRVFLIGLWGGYFLYGLVKNYHIHTHPYYELPFVPIVALSLGFSVAIVLGWFAVRNSPPSYRIPVAGILILAILLAVGLYLRERQEMPDFRTEVSMSMEIGEVVKHSSRTLVLASFSGRQLMYHGEFAGGYWPDAGEIKASRLWGKADMSVPEHFSMLSAKTSPEFFVVRDLQEFDRQKDLQEYLRANYPVRKETDQYVIFDLRKRLTGR